MPWLTKEQVWSKLQGFRADHQKNYFGFYSSRLGGFCQDPAAMLIPLDDHMVHRGDGIFEVFRVMDGVLIDFRAHYARLIESAKAVEMDLRWSESEVRDLCLELVRLCREGEGLIRLFVSRGEGGFTTNPKESLQSELYLVMTKFKAPLAEWYASGVDVISSKWTWKDAPFAQIKSCNYLLNVFLKQEANKAGAHFSVAFDVEGFMTESSTENVILVDYNQADPATLIIPEWFQILRGTTLMWVLELARANGFRVEQKKISREMIVGAHEAAIVGTTWGVLPIGQWDGVHLDRSLVASTRFPVCTQLRELLSKAMLTDSSRRTG